METVEELVKIFRVVFSGGRTKNRGWVLFENGTIVIIRADKAGDLKEIAIEILKEYGPVYPGGPAGDMATIECEDLKGGVLITGHHSDVLTYVSRAELKGKHDLAGALHGRGKRHKDGTELIVVHVEEKTGEQLSDSVSDSAESNPASDSESNSTSEPETNESPSKSKRIVTTKRKRNKGSSDTKTAGDLTEKRHKKNRQTRQK